MSIGLMILCICGGVSMLLVIWTPALIFWMCDSDIFTNILLAVVVALLIATGVGTFLAFYKPSL